MILRNGCLVVVGVAAAWLAAAPLSAQSLPPEMVEMARVFRVHARDFGTRYAETIQNQPRQYTNDVQALRDRFQQNGDLDGVLATARELKRFQEAMSGERDPFELTPEMPASARVDKPVELRLLQEQYVARFKEAAETRMRGIRDLTVKYVASLQKIQSDLTRAGRITEAIAVKQESERLQQGLNGGNLMQLVERMASELPANAETPAISRESGDAPMDGVPVYGSIPDWAKWKYAGASNFSRERSQHNNPDVPDELNVTYNEKIGRGRFFGRCMVGSMQIGVALCRWFGKALVWEVRDPRTLTATFVLTSRQLSAGEEHGPSAQLAVLANGVAVRQINVNLLEHETILRLVKDPHSNRCALMWPRGKITETFELPANAALGVLLGVTVRNPGELCDTALQLQ